MSIEQLVISNLVKNEKYARKVLPFLQDEYFQDFSERILFSFAKDYIQKYNNLPTIEALRIEIDTNADVNEQQNKNILALLDKVYEKTEVPDFDWLMSQTEKFCQDKALYNAIFKCIQITDDKTSKLSKNAIPEILKEALGVTFETNVGHDFIEDAEKRWDYYHRVENKIPFDLEYLNKITNGGMTPKTLTVIVAPTGGGKSIFLCHHAAACLRQNKNVLYITCEMSEESVSERIDANMLNVTMEELRALPKQIYDNKFKKSTAGITGKVIVKEYPTSTASVVNFDHLLSELKVKKNFIPDVVFIDYLNICASARYKSNDNSYMFVKAIAEEIRGFAVRHNVPVFTASQVNRGGFNNSDVDLTNTSESMGVPHTADLMLAIISNDGLDALNQVIFKQLKNRRNDASTHKRFVVGIDRSKMKFFDLDESAQNGLVDTGDEDEEKEKVAPKQKGKFQGWN